MLNIHDCSMLLRHISSARTDNDTAVQQQCSSSTAACTRGQSKRAWYTHCTNRMPPLLAYTPDSEAHAPYRVSWIASPQCPHRFPTEEDGQGKMFHRHDRPSRWRLAALRNRCSSLSAGPGTCGVHKYCCCFCCGSETQQGTHSG